MFRSRYVLMEVSLAQADGVEKLQLLRGIVDHAPKAGIIRFGRSASSHASGRPDLCARRTADASSAMAYSAVAPVAGGVTHSSPGS